MALKVEKLVETLQPLLQWHSGEKSLEILGISPPHDAQSGHIIFVPNPKALTLALKSDASALVVSEKHLDQTCGFSGAILTSPAISLALSQTGQRFFPNNPHKEAFDGERIHSSSVVSKSAEIDSTAIIHPNVTIGPNVIIDKNCIIGAGTVIDANCHIGEESHIHNQVSISHGTILGKKCEIHPQTSLGTEGFGYAQDQHFNHHRIHHYGKLILGDRVHLGAGVTVDRGTFDDSHIKSGTIVDNMVHFGHNFNCGENTIFVGGTIVAGSVTIGSRCVVGGRVTIGGHLKICDDVQIAGVSAITKNITKPGKYGGYPLLPLNDSLRSLASLAALPEMRKTLAELSKKVEN